MQKTPLDMVWEICNDWRQVDAIVLEATRYPRTCLEIHSGYYAVTDRPVYSSGTVVIENIGNLNAVQLKEVLNNVLRA